MLSRRSFVAVSVSAAVCSRLPLRLAAQQRTDEVTTNANLGPYQQGLLTAAGFERLVGTRFWVRLEDGTTRTMVLSRVVPRKAQLLTASQTEQAVETTKGQYGITRRLSSFVAVFEVEGRPLPQNSYVVDSAMIGRFAVLLVPGQGTMCHATFTSFGPEE